VAKERRRHRTREIIDTFENHFPDAKGKEKEGLSAEQTVGDDEWH